MRKLENKNTAKGLLELVHTGAQKLKNSIDPQHSPIQRQRKLRRFFRFLITSVNDPQILILLKVYR